MSLKSHQDEIHSSNQVQLCAGKSGLWAAISSSHETERCRFLSRLPFSLQEWRAHYIDYPHLKKIIYAIAKAEADELQVHDEEHLGHPLLPGEMENKVTAGDSLCRFPVCRMACMGRLTRWGTRWLLGGGAHPLCCMHFECTLAPLWPTHGEV